MTIVEHKWSALSVRDVIEVLDRMPKQCDDDADLDAMEAQLLWPRVWQMAHRLEEILNVGDFSFPEVWSLDHPRWPPIVDLEL